MPLDLDFFEGFLDLLDFLFHWRFWLCVLVAIAVVWLIHRQVSDPDVRWALSIPVLLVGAVIGWVWNLRSE